MEEKSGQLSASESEPEEGEHLRADGLVKAFTLGTERIDILRDLGFSARRRERVFLVGASGAGKTTLLYCLAGLERPQEGEVFLGGVSLYRASSPKQARIRNEKMGFIFQNYFLLPELTALENVMLPSLLRRRPATEQARESLDAVGLGQRLDHLPAELSGGEQQRVAIARALINDPEIVFADEPTGNLDRETGDEVMELLMKQVEERAKTLIVVTHNMRLANRGDRLLRLVDGKLQD